MNYHKIEKCSTSNGEGFRTVIWVSGCSVHCNNCQNPQTWEFESGLLFTNETKQELFAKLDKPYISGLTLSGGHPLESQNIETCTTIAKEFKKRFPNKTLWVYTGYLWNEIKNLEIMKYTDVLIDGRYIDEKRDITLPWRGSTNQRVIDVQKSLNKGKIVLYIE